MITIKTTLTKQNTNSYYYKTLALRLLPIFLYLILVVSIILNICLSETGFDIKEILFPIIYLVALFVLVMIMLIIIAIVRRAKSFKGPINIVYTFYDYHFQVDVTLHNGNTFSQKIYYLQIKKVTNKNKALIIYLKKKLNYFLVIKDENNPEDIKNLLSLLSKRTKLVGGCV